MIHIYKIHNREQTVIFIPSGVHWLRMRYSEGDKMSLSMSALYIVIAFNVSLWNRIETQIVFQLLCFLKFNSANSNKIKKSKLCSWF